jgi:hypothetical protein
MPSRPEERQFGVEKLGYFGISLKGRKVIKRFSVPPSVQRRQRSGECVRTLIRRRSGCGVGLWLCCRRTRLTAPFGGMITEADSQKKPIGGSHEPMVRRPYADGNRDTRSWSASCVGPALPLAISVYVTDADVDDAALSTKQKMLLSSLNGHVWIGFMAALKVSG